MSAPLRTRAALARNKLSLRAAGVQNRHPGYVAIAFAVLVTVISTSFMVWAHRVGVARHSAANLARVVRAAQWNWIKNDLVDSNRIQWVAILQSVNVVFMVRAHGEHS